MTNESNNNATEVKRNLRSRHISMIAIGGCIGSGLFMTSGQAIQSAGPGGAIVAYLCIGLMVYFLMTSLGEMATYLPTSGSFSTYAGRYVDPSLGFALGWNYWFNWVITVAADVELSALAISYWEPMRVLPHWAWSLLFLVIIIALNALSVKVYGESEYWFALIKVVVVIIFLVVGTVFDFVTKNYVFFKNKIGLNHLNDTITEGYFGRTVAKQIIITNLAELAVYIFFVAMVVLVCVVFKTQILSLVLVMLSLLGTGLIQSLTILAVSKFSWAKYHMFDVPLFSSYYSSEAGRQTVKEMFKFDNANALIIMLVAYSFVFFTISYIVNARRDITID